MKAIIVWERHVPCWFHLSMYQVHGTDHGITTVIWLAKLPNPIENIGSTVKRSRAAS